MSYTPPSGDAVDFAFGGSAYVAPDGDAVDFDFSEPVVGAFPYYALELLYPA